MKRFGITLGFRIQGGVGKNPVVSTGMENGLETICLPRAVQIGAFRLYAIGAFAEVAKTISGLLESTGKADGLGSIQWIGDGNHLFPLVLWWWKRTERNLDDKYCIILSVTALNIAHLFRIASRSEKNF